MNYTLILERNLVGFVFTGIRTTRSEAVMYKRPSPPKTKFDTDLSSKANLPIKFQESFSNVLINKSDSGHQKSKSSSSNLEILNKSCCGIYPNRRPYTLGNLQKGSIRMCCGEKTYNPAKLECCRGSILMKRCPVGIEVTYNIY